MSSVVRNVFIVFVLFINFEDSLIRCQLNVRYTHAINDCFHLCFGIRACIEDCEQGYRRRPPDFSDRYDRNRRNPRNSINYYKGQTISNIDKSSKKSLAKPSTHTISKDKIVSSFQMLEIAQPSHCGLRYKQERERDFRQGMPPFGVSGMGRIVGGEDAEPNEFPWLVSLQITKKGLPDRHFCGAAIINEYYILTAAHCTDSLRGKERQIIIKAGINSPDENVEVVRPEKFIIHEGWDVERQVNDISLIRLINPIRFKTNNLGQYIVNALCLPSDFSDPKGFAQLAGWGQLTEEDKESADWLQKITLPIWNRPKCRQNYKEYMNILKTHICAGGRGGHDSCMGDSGGPLMHTKGDRTFMLGVVSFGIPCAVEGLPGVYTHLAYYMDWISDNMI